MSYKLERFIDAQRNDYDTALNEIRQGRKRSHWIWYIFPNIAGLGYSSTSRYYAIKDIGEARAYLDNGLLRGRLEEISSELLKLEDSNAVKIMGSPDDLKLRSCMTLFLKAEPGNKIFASVLEKFFGGEEDARTVEILKSQFYSPALKL
jgi:uncharacterized protein (DUF1810 family)